MIKSKLCALSASENEVRICNNSVCRFFAQGKQGFVLFIIAR